MDDHVPASTRELVRLQQKADNRGRAREQSARRDGADAVHKLCSSTDFLAFVLMD